jgi:hypothetical protein
MEKEKYISDLHEIRNMMDRSSKFISLSGMAGIAAGIFALAGAYFAYTTVYKQQDYLNYRRADLSNESVFTLMTIAVAVLILSVGAGIFFTHRRSKKVNQSLWDAQAKRLISNLMIPLAAGGILCLILLSKGFVGLVAPLTLVFYGLALVNASKYTLTEIRSLGIVEIILGLLACQFIGYGLLFWVIGFGVLHIVYGIAMYSKYGS